MSTKLFVISERNFVSEHDYQLQQKAAFEKFVSMNGVNMNLTHLEQQLVHEHINLSFFYPEWNDVVIVSPYSK